MEVVRNIQPYQTPSGWLVGAKTNLMDRFAPAIEQIFLPPTTVVGGELRFEERAEKRESRAKTPESKKQKLRKLFSPSLNQPESLPDDCSFLDFRYENPENWSHTVNKQIILAQFARRAFSGPDGAARFGVVLPTDIPAYIVAVYELFGFDVVLTDRPVVGRICRYEVNPPLCLRATMWSLADEVLSEAMRALIGTASSELPAKVFVSRRGTRTLKNEAEVEGLLSERGFVKIYPEALPIVDQFRLFSQATHIVGVHGAGLGPLAYRPRGATGCQFVELLSPGHLTNFYRVIAAQAGVSWVGVRGRLSSELFPGAYEFSRPFLEHSLADFEVDPVALDRALDLVAGESPHEH